MRRSPAIALLTSLCVSCAISPHSPRRDAQARSTLRAASVFPNLDFEEVNAQGRPTGWRCACPEPSGEEKEVACRTTTMNPGHGSRALVLSKGCYALAGTKNFDATRGLTFDLVAAGARVYPGDLQALGVSDQMERDHAFVDGTGITSDAWHPVTSIGAVSTAGDDQVALYLKNSSNTELRLDDIIAVQDVPQPEPKSGTLLFADHYERMAYSAGTGNASLYTPLPIDYATQVPLDVELRVEPRSVVERIEYVADGENNWGAIVHFVPRAHSGAVTLAWQAVVLTREVSDGERPTLFAAKENPAAWLAPTALANSTYAPLAAAAHSLPAASSTLDKLTAILGLTREHLTTKMVSALDATTAWNAGGGSCTSFANFTSAIARALGIPARHITNIAVGISQQVHSLNELYLGPELGWRRIEPQRANASLPADRNVILRVVTPADEGAAALASRFWLLGGVPLHEFTEPVEGVGRFTHLDGGTHFSDCGTVGECVNRADPHAILRGSFERMKSTFDRARSLWATDRAGYLSGRVIAAHLARRKMFRSAYSLEDVDRVLDALSR